MRIINYVQNRFISNVALVVDLESTKQIIYGDAIMQIYDDEATFYKIAQQRAMHAKGIDSPSFSASILSKYDVYTVDLYGYKELYMLVNGIAHKVFNKWQEVLVDVLSNDLKAVYGNECKYNVLSIANQQYMPLSLPKTTNTAQYYGRNFVNAARLINIAIPKELNVSFRDFYTATGSLTKYDVASSHSMLSCEVIPQTTYSLSDFMHLTYAKGQVVKLRKRHGLTADIVMQNADGFNRQVLCLNRRLDNMHDLEMYLTVTEDAQFYYINFVYNLNRTYTVSANTDIVVYKALSNKTVQISSNDMLKHANMLGKVYNDKYMLMQTKQNTITLPAVYKQIMYDNLPMSSWTGDEYWYGATYLYNKLLVNNDDKLNLFRKLQPAEYYGNLHTFMLETAIAPVDNDYNFHTNGLLDNGLDIAFSKVSLPCIQDGKVTFRNITVTFSTEHNFDAYRQLDGKKFAIVLCHDRHYAGKEFAKAGIIWSANYAVLRLTANLSDVLELAKQANTSQLSISDFYSANKYELLPSHIYQYALAMRTEGFRLWLNYTGSDILMDLPVE